jgi:hypothetical protein
VSVHNLILAKMPTGEVAIVNPWAWTPEQQVLRGIAYTDLSVENSGIVENEHLRQDIGSIPAAPAPVPSPGPRIILDHHRSEAGSGAYGSGLWYTAAEGLFSSFETPTTIAMKAGWAEAMGFGGIVFWDITNDAVDSPESLVKAAYDSWVLGEDLATFRGRSRLTNEIIVGGDGVIGPLPLLE